MRWTLCCMAVVAFACNSRSQTPETAPASDSSARQIQFPENSWPYFLQHLPTGDGKVVDYRGVPVTDQKKHFAIVKYDVGNSDLQQCADALMRLRAEFLFANKRADEIGFHFMNGHLFRYANYCKGERWTQKGNNFVSYQTDAVAQNHETLRNYLNIVYMYAGTISLAKELKPANAFDVGTVVIWPGSPGHCCIIVDKMVKADGKEVFKIAEGYSPAQSIYILKNPDDGSCWYPLEQGKPVATASCTFYSYKTMCFE